MSFLKSYIFWISLIFLMGFFIPFASFRLASFAYQYYFNSQSQIIVFEREKTLPEKKEPDNNNLSANIITGNNVEKPDNNVSMIFVGDIMFDRGVLNSVMKNGDGDYAFLFKNADFIKNADISFGNLEGPVSDTGKDLKNLYSFRFEPSAIKALKNSGFDVLSVANNHIGDWGRDAFKDNLLRLINEGFLAVGGGVNKENADSVKIIGKQGIRFGFLAFSDVGPNWLEAGENESGISIVRDELITNLIRSVSQRVDVLVVSFHFGEEYQKNANDRQKKLAHLAIDSGAKIVVGHHPHVVQEVERYKDGVIAYSLGNFIFDQNFSEETMQGLALEVILKGTEIITVKQNKIKINEFLQPELSRN